MHQAWSRGLACPVEIESDGSNSYQRTPTHPRHYVLIEQLLVDVIGLGRVQVDMQPFRSLSSQASRTLLESA